MQFSLVKGLHLIKGTEYGALKAILGIRENLRVTVTG